MMPGVTAMEMLSGSCRLQQLLYLFGIAPASAMDSLDRRSGLEAAVWRLQCSAAVRPGFQETSYRRGSLNTHTQTFMLGHTMEPHRARTAGGRLYPALQVL